MQQLREWPFWVVRRRCRQRRPYADRPNWLLQWTRAHWTTPVRPRDALGPFRKLDGSCRFLRSTSRRPKTAKNTKRNKFFRKLSRAPEVTQSETSHMVRDDYDVTPELRKRRGEGRRSHSITTSIFVHNFVFMWSHLMVSMYVYRAAFWRN